jgi:hypothetical protein
MIVNYQRRNTQITLFKPSIFMTSVTRGTRNVNIFTLCVCICMYMKVYFCNLFVFRCMNMTHSQNISVNVALENYLLHLHSKKVVEEFRFCYGNSF